MIYKNKITYLCIKTIGAIKAMKPYQIKMRPEDHNVLKSRAKGLNITISQMIGNLFGSMELRVDAVFQTICKGMDFPPDASSCFRNFPKTLHAKTPKGLSKPQRTTEIDAVIYEEIFKSDMCDCTSETNWTAKHEEICKSVIYKLMKKWRNDEEEDRSGWAPKMTLPGFGEPQEEEDDISKSK